MRTISLTSKYPFNKMTVGSSFTVYERFQHARVAASEYGRKHSQAFSCRINYDEAGNKSMAVIRCADSQAKVDTRGRNARRAIPENRIESAALNMPTREQFGEWLRTLNPGQSWPIPIEYAGMFPQMIAWTAELSALYQCLITAGLWHDGTLMITYVA